MKMPWRMAWGAALVALCGLAAAGRAQNVSATQEVVIGTKQLHPQSLDVDAVGNIYVGGGSEIWVYDREGNWKETRKFGWAQTVRVSPEQKLYVGRAAERDSQIRMYEMGGQAIGSFGLNKWLHGDALGFDVPWDLALDAEGRAWSANTHNITQGEARKDIPNTAWGGMRVDVNGGRLMCFDLKKDPGGRKPKYFGTFSNTPPEAGGPADGLHRPARVAIDVVHKKVFVLDDWGVSRWNQADGAFEKRVIRAKMAYGTSLLAATPGGTLYVQAGDDKLCEYDVDGKKMGERAGIDVAGASDLRVTADGSLYLCYPKRWIAFKKFSPEGKLLLCRGLNAVTLRLAMESKVATAGEKFGVTAQVLDRRELYQQEMPELAEISRNLWVRPYQQGAAWQALKLEKEADGKEYVVLPGGMRGAVQLRLTTSAMAAELLDESSAGLQLGLAVRGAADKTGTLTVCTDRMQQVFCSGQWMRVNVIGRSQVAVADEAVMVQLVGPQEKVMAQKQLNWAIAGSGSAALAVDVRLPVDMSAGAYVLRAVSPALGAAEFPVRVAVAQEAGRFKMMAALNLGLREPAEGVEDYVGTLAEAGITHDVSRYISHGGDIGGWGNDLDVNRQMRALLAGDPRLPAAESTELPSRMRVALDRMASRGMHLWPEVMSWELDTVNRTAKQEVQDKQNLGRWTMWGLRSPALDGFLWNESNWWGIGQARLQTQWAAATGGNVELLKGINWGALKACDPPLSGATLAAALSYQQYMAQQLYPKLYQQWQDYTRGYRPGLTGAGVPALYPCNWPEWCAAPLDVVTSYHQDEQICEPYMQLNDSAFMLHSGKPFYAGVELYPETGTGEYLAKQLLPGLLYGAEGFWANDMAGMRDSMKIGVGSFFRRAEELQAAGDLRAVLEPVGARLRGARYRALVGIYFPRAAYVQQGNIAFAGDSYQKRVSAAMIASFHAHVPARIVYDEELKAGKVTDVKSLLLPGLKTDVTAEDMAALDRFAKGGGTILTATDCADPYKGLGKLVDADFSIFAPYDYTDWYTQDALFDKRLKVMNLAQQMSKALAPYVQPPVFIDDPEVWYSLLDGKDNAGKAITYLVTVQQGCPKNLRADQLWKMASSFNAVVPAMRTAQVPANFRYGYDILGGKALEIVGGRLALDFRRFPARVMALADHPLVAADLREGNGAAVGGQGDVQMEAPPQVDVFFAEKIRLAMHRAEPIWVVGEEKVRQPALVEMGKLKLVGRASAAIDSEAEIHVVMAGPNDPYWVDRNDVMPVRLGDNVPAAGSAVMVFEPAYLPGARDAIVIAARDEAGRNAALAKLAELAQVAEPMVETRLVAPAIRPAPAAALDQDSTGAWGARLTTLKVAGDTVVVGAAEWGNNLFLLDASAGKVRSATKAGRFYVDDLHISQDGSSIGAEAMYPEDANGALELFSREGQPVARFMRDGINSHANWNYQSFVVRRDIISFAMAPDGQTVFSGSNGGLTAFKRDGAVLWRHDYGKLNVGLDLLRSKWAPRLDLSPDGQHLAAALTHEQYPGSDYRGSSTVQLIEAGTGKMLWEKELAPIETPQIAHVKISPDGKTVAVLDIYHGLVMLREGQIVKQRAGAFVRIHWSRDGRMLLALLEKDSRTGILALDAKGAPLWQYEQASPVIALDAVDGGGVVIADAGRHVTLLSDTGTVVWTAPLEATGNVASTKDAIYACDWHGNVYKLDRGNGKQVWKTNLTDRVWRDDIESLPSQPYAGKTFGQPQRRPAEEPATGLNLAAQAKLEVGGIKGWFGTGKVQIDAARLTDGKIDDLERPWLNPTEHYKAATWSRYVWIEMTWPKPVTIRSLSIHEDSRHPEAWPYDGCLQVWKDGAWEDVATSQLMPGPWHNIKLETPLTAERIRYCVTNCLVNNVWTDEIRVSAP